MACSSPVLLPCCTHCSAIRADGSWLTVDGGAAKTAEKLSACARCHVARYCNAVCQRSHWPTHKVGCIASEKVISPDKVDQMVAKACKPQPGKVHLYLDWQNELLQSELFPGAKAGELCVELSIKTTLVGCFNYLICNPNQGFDWKSKLSLIRNPLDQIDLGHEMIEKGLCNEAFHMIAGSSVRYGFLTNMFFPKAIQLMSSQGISIETMLLCAQLLNKNLAEVEVVLHPPTPKELPQDLQTRIEVAQKLDHGKRDLQMVPLAKEVMELDLYDQAFDLIYNWVIMEPPKKVFFAAAAKHMISKGVDYERIVQLAKTISLTESHVLNEVVGIYPYHGQTKFACQLAQQSNNSDHYLEIVFSALTLQKKNEEAREILNLVSLNKRRDLEIHLSRS